MKRFIRVAGVAVAVVAAASFVLFGESTNSPTGSPPRLLAWIAKAFPDAIFYRDTTEKVVALTIDDVPWAGDPGDAATTQLILDTIAEHNEGTTDPALRVRATFFVISGQLTDGSTILDRILQDGHEIGNHGEADGTAAMLPADAFEEQLRASDQRLVEFTDHPIRWFRPGRGLFTAAMVSSIRGMKGYEPRFVLASMLPIDTFRPADDPRFTAWYVGKQVFPGAILVLHGGSPEQSAQTAEALKAVLWELGQRGYRVVTLSELLDPD